MTATPRSGKALAKAREAWPTHSTRSWLPDEITFCNDDDPCTLHAAVASALEQWGDARLEEAAGVVPFTWLDPLLTGDKQVIDSPPYNCPDVERLLHAVRDRILALRRPASDESAPKGGGQ